LPSAFNTAKAAPKVGALSVLMSVGFPHVFQPFSALPGKRLAAAVFRVGDR